MELKNLRAPAVKRGMLCILLSLSAVAATHSLDAQFGWSFGNVGLSHDFVGGNGIIDAEILKCIVDFEQTGLVLSASIFSGTNKKDRQETEPFYNSFLPLEISYSLFKWKYAHLAVYGRGGWEIGYTGNITEPRQISNGFFGSAGFRAGLLPMKQNIFRYRSCMITLFYEYTTHNEFKVGASIDLFYAVYAAVKIQSVEKRQRGSAPL
jgi:hypothetical protein